MVRFLIETIEIPIGLQVAAVRVRDNDRLNALLIATTARHADVLVPSLPLSR
jgi:hypothetical protein